MQPVTGPDPGRLSDDDLAGAARLLADLAGRVADLDPEVLDARTLAHLDPARRWTVEAIRTLWQVLRLEDERRTAAEAQQLVDEVEQFLARR
jgi:hypothetical protein